MVLMTARRETTSMSRFELQEKLGAGGMGTVYRALDRETGSPVAIKVLSAKLAENPKLHYRLVQEFRSASKLDHPNIVRALDLVVDGSTAYLVMEYVEGDSLGGLIAKHGRLPEGQAVRIVTQAAQGLHRADVVLVGLSRTSKTPLSTYLAQRGLKVANVPVVLGLPLPRELETIDQTRIYGLKITAGALIRIRRARPRHPRDRRGRGRRRNGALVRAGLVVLATDWGIVVSRAVVLLVIVVAGAGVVLLVVVGLGAVAVPLGQLHLAFPTDSTASPETTQRKASDLVAEAFGPGRESPMLLVVDGREIADERERPAAYGAVVEWAAGLDNVRFSPEAIAGAISKAKNQLLVPDRYAQQALDFFGQTVAHVYPIYEKRMRDANALDFDDLLLWPALALKNDAELRAELDHRFRFVLIDEYQDTNKAQYQIVRALSQVHRNLCVTGDPDQSIYGWRGARIANILRFEQDYPEARVIRLEDNFRSTQAILRSAGRLIDHNTQRKDKRLVTPNAEGEPVELLVYPDSRAEADGIARRIQTEIDEHDRTPLPRKRRSQVDSGRRLPDAAFLIDERDAAHPARDCIRGPSPPIPEFSTPPRGSKAQGAGPTTAISTRSPRIIHARPAFSTTFRQRPSRSGS